MNDATTTCTIEGCERSKVARGWCKGHYERWRKYKNPTAIPQPKPRPRRDLGERFWEKVDASGDCWEWIGTRKYSGYGAFNVGGKMQTAHRVSWELLVGPIPAGFVVDHLCRNPPCVNPDHLEPVTQQENVLRGRVAVKGSNHHQARKTHCPRGHEYTEKNTYRYGPEKRHRMCRECRNERQRELGKLARQVRNATW